MTRHAWIAAAALGLVGGYTYATPPARAPRPAVYSPEDCHAGTVGVVVLHIYHDKVIGCMCEQTGTGQYEFGAVTTSGVCP